LSHAIVVALRLDVSPERSRRLDETPTDDREAYAEYSQAGAFLERQDLPGNVERARDLFHSAVTRDPEFALAQAGLAEAYWQLYVESGDVQWTDKASRSAERARELDPEHPSVHYSSAVIDFGMGRYENGLMELNQALVLKPGHDEALQLKGHILERLGQLDAAADAYRRAIDIRPAYWGHYRRLGLLYLNAGRFQEAQDTFRRITELQPDLSWGHQTLGMAYHMEGDVDEAIIHYKRAIDIGNSPAALSNLGVIYYRRRDYEKANAAFRDSLELEEDAVSRRNLGDALRKLGRESEARAEYERAIALVRKQLEVNPNDALPLSIWGLCEAKLGRDEQAQRRARQAERVAPRDVDVLHRLAVVHAFAGRSRQAVDALRRALSFGLSPSEVAADDDFDSIRESPEFQSLLNPTSR
jgi:tetratricopeptide (TPR) repeat protein